MEFVERWDGRYRWPLREDHAIVDKKFVLSTVEMKASGKQYLQLHQPTEKDLQKEHKEYSRKFFSVGETEIEHIATYPSTTPVKQFCHVGREWQVQKCLQLGIELISPISSKNKQKMTIYSKPMSRVEVVPDGDCFFRSICYWLTGTMDQHHKVRLAVVSFMKEKWSEQGKRIVGKHFQTYLTKFKMDDDGTWATETEIFATADLLKTTIMVFTKGTESYKWVTHSPSKREKGDSAKKLYLINECNHYEPVTRLCK